MIIEFAEPPYANRRLLPNRRSPKRDKEEALEPQVLTLDGRWAPANAQSSSTAQQAE